MSRDRMRTPPFPRDGRSSDLPDRFRQIGPFRLWATKYDNWTNYYGSSFLHCQFWIGNLVEFAVHYSHYRWPEFHHDRSVQIRWTLPVLRYLTGQITHEWEIKPPIERRYIESIERFR